MFAAKGPNQDIATVRVAILVGAVALVVYWRLALRLLIMILAIAAITLLGAGAFELLQATHA